MTELCDLIAQNPAQFVEKLAWICGRCPPPEALLVGSPRVSRSQLNAILAVARFLSKCPSHSDEMPKSIILAFYLKSLKNPFCRQQDVRATEIDKVDMHLSFRPGDIVKALVVSFLLEIPLLHVH